MSVAYVKKHQYMESINFEILRNQWPDLAALGGFAEKYVFSDPPSALIKLRTFIERMVDWMFRQHRWEVPLQPSLFDHLQSTEFNSRVPAVVVGKFHILRLQGNNAAHGKPVQEQTAVDALREAFDLARWFFMSYGGGSLDKCPQFQQPPAEESKGQLKREKKAILEQLVAREAELQALLQKLDQAQKAAQEAQKKVGELQAVSEAAQRAAAEGAQRVAAEAAETLQFDEHATRRRLIDTLLIESHWQVGARGTNTEEVGQEYEVLHQPTPSGIGYADYVLWDDNHQPLAVIEAKRTSENVEIGKTQAQLYADGLEKMHGRRPVIYYTNGYDIYLWDDAQNYPPRRVFGFHSKDSLQFLVYQRASRKPLNTIEPKKEITDRLYQTVALKKVCERFEARHRKALIVQATGTGKTRVAISLTDMLQRAGWVKRVLFLCDRLELRRQAKNVFANFIQAPLTVVTAETANDRTKLVYLATYPAMMKIFQTFDPGFFDLIIADETHRSIFNRYRDLFRYFDALQVGLTATPVDKMERNTFRMFDCPEKQPTYYYSLTEAISEGYLVPYEVFSMTTRFLREGIQFGKLTEAEREQLEEDGEDPRTLNYLAADLDRAIFNKDTNRHILRHLMDNGLRDATGQMPGKSLIFARNHKHAVLLMQLFNEMYPQYGGKICQVIDNYDPRADQLIDNFKNPAHPLTIAVSVDMLDTGIDVPEIVNLVFARPVFTWVKFWQMIGRGTRLCKDLYGPGQHKTKFRIFDHWGNFDQFSVERPEVVDPPSKSLLQQVFEARLKLAETALQTPDQAAFAVAAELLRQDLNRLPEESISVREKWREKRLVARPETLNAFTPETVRVLRNDMAPLMKWVPLEDHAAAWQFDLLVARLQLERLRDSGRFADLKGHVLDRVGSLLMHLNPVREKSEAIARVKSPAFWSAPSMADLEQMRQDLRGIMHHVRSGPVEPGDLPRVIDLADGKVQITRRSAGVTLIDQVVVKDAVEKALKDLFDTDLTLRKIRRAEPVSKHDLDALTSLVLTQHPDVDLAVLKDYFPETAGPLDFVIRTIVGMDRDVVAGRFAEFGRRHPKLTAKQTRFLQLLQNHIVINGTVTVGRLYEAPFTSVDSDGLDGVFAEEDLADELVQIVKTFEPPTEEVTPQ